MVNEHLMSPADGLGQAADEVEKGLAL